MASLPHSQLFAWDVLERTSVSAATLKGVPLSLLPLLEHSATRVATSSAILATVTEIFPFLSIWSSANAWARNSAPNFSISSIIRRSLIPAARPERDSTILQEANLVVAATHPIKRLRIRYWAAERTD